jgi:adenine phosphoribosyltransferase
VLLEEVYQDAPAILTGAHLTTLNEFTDQQPALRPEVLGEVCARIVELGEFSGDKLLVEEDKGAVLGAAVCLATGLPLAMARWYTYDVRAAESAPAPIVVPLESEYYAGKLYVNGIQPGDRVVIVDDTISTGGTLAALIHAVQGAGAKVTEVLVVVEKVAAGGVSRIWDDFGIKVRSVIRIDIDRTTRRTRVVP